MTNALAWSLIVIGVGHIAYGIVKFWKPLAEATSAGFIGQFMLPEIRHTAFWFVIFGLLVILAGHVAVHAVAIGDVTLLRIIGTYTFVTSVIGVAAIPKSGFWASLVVSSLLLASVYGLFK
jgi:hypothetical protein